MTTFKPSLASGGVHTAIPVATIVLLTSNGFEALARHNDNPVEEDNKTALGATSHPALNE